MSNQYVQVVERIDRVVRDRGDIEVMVLLDRIMDHGSEPEQAAALAGVVRVLNQNKQSGGASQTGAASSTQTQGEGGASPQ